MKKPICALLLLVMGLCANAQSTLKDSLATLKTNKQILELKAKIVQQRQNLSEEVDRYKDLKKQSVDLNDDATTATERGKKASSDIIAGDAKSTKAASKAMDKAQKANKKLQNNLDDQASSQKKIGKYNDRIKKYSTQLNDLEQKAGVPLTPIPEPVTVATAQK